MEELIIIEYDKEFIPVYKTEKGTEVIRGSELHNGLNVEKAFSTWIKKQLENIDAIENIDFSEQCTDKDFNMCMAYQLY